MKTLKISLLASITWLAGCIQDTVPAVPVEEQTYPLTFKVSGLDVSDELMTRNSPATATRAEGSPPIYEKFQKLEYHGYITKAQKFKGTQTYDPAKPEEFGNVKVQVPDGTYYFGFFGIAPGVKYKIVLGSPIMGDNDYLENAGGGEIWYKELKSFKVAAETKSVDMVMTRLTGRLVLDITDQVPERVKRVTATFYYPTRYILTYGNGMTYSNSVPIERELTILDNKVSLFEFNSYRINGSVVLSVYDKNDVLLDERTVRASTYENRKTIIRGELFNNIDGKDFVITVSDDWGEDNVVNL